MIKPPTDVALWPFPALRVVSGDLELRYLDDGLLHDLARLAGEGVHPEESMPFPFAWSKGTPTEVGRRVLAHQWKTRAELADGGTRVQLAVVHAGVPVGIQGFSGTDVPVTRAVTTGSWLGLQHHGHGTGTRMRRLVLHLLFEGLGMREATTSAFADNGPSNGVTRRIGYAPNGTEVTARDGEPVVSNLYRLTRGAWQEQADRPHVELHGVDAVRTFLGL